jgi:uncharacterized protein (DUF1499 family)
MHILRNTLLMIGLLTLLGCAGDRPSTLGAQDGTLAACPDSPNCVSSFDERESHGIAPIAGSLAQVRAAVESMKGAQIISADDNYLYAEFTSSLMGYVDDVEFLAAPSEGVSHVRSASRLGYSDMGVNRKRIEEIRVAVAAQ